MPKVSVFTPSHDSTWLDDCYFSLLQQNFTDWEWVVVLNQRASWNRPDDSRVHLYYENNVAGVGDAKRIACNYTTGEILVELDHDDYLLPYALEAIVDEFDGKPHIGFVYSHTAQTNVYLSDGGRPFDPAYGWEYKEIRLPNGRQQTVTLSMEPSPHNVSYIWYAPNHVRAFRRSVYDQIGGYDQTRQVLDDQDLICRMYQVTEFSLIDDCLYLQRAHEKNTQADPQINPHIQTETIALYDTHIQPNALAWAERNGLLVLDLGAAYAKPPGYVGIDLQANDDVDLVGDVFDVLEKIPDNSVGVIRAVDFLEHIADSIKLMNECYRVLTHGGLLLTLTPSTDGRGAFQDPTHVSFWNENSFWYFTDDGYRMFVPAIKARFQVSRLVSYFPSDWHQANSMPYVNANLIAIKDGPRQGGILKIG